MKTVLLLLMSSATLVAHGQTFPIGPNLAAGKPVTVSSSENAGTSGRFAVDGSFTTRWSSAFSDPQWLYVDLGAPTAVTKVRINWEAAYGRDFEVQFSNDAQTWTPVRTVTGNTQRINLISGLTGTPQYVRIYGTARATGYGYSIYELEVSGSNTAPSVTLTAPAANSTYNGPIRLAADATDPDGAVRKVDFYIDDALVASDAAAPYETVWNSTPGTHVVKAVATDDNGATTTSFARTFYVDSNATPTITLTAPAANSTYSGQSIRLAADAADPDGKVELVEFLVDEPNGGYRVIGTTSTSPYEVLWRNVPPGTYRVWARVTDNGGPDPLTARATARTAAREIYVINDPFNKSIPGQIEAEQYDAMRGVATEPTADAGGGQNIGYLDPGDWLDYQVNVQTAGTYAAQFRVAGFAAGAQLQVQVGGAVLATVAVPSTGGGQSWTTISAPVTLAAGAQTLRVAVVSGGFNLNWFSFSPSTSARAASGVAAPTPPAEVLAYPNPSPGLVRLAGAAEASPVTITNKRGAPVLETTVRNGAVDLRALPAGVYYLRLPHARPAAPLRIVKE